MRNKNYFKSLKRLGTVVLIMGMAFTVISCSKKPTVESGTDNPTVVPTEAGSDKEEAPIENLSYTYNNYMGGTPNKFNPHEWETNEDSYIMTYTQMGFYDFILNEAKDGYDIIPEMAAGDPIDITSEYAGNETFGTPADATSGYAFKIPLNDKATWEDGTPINADTYIYSMQQMLDPGIKNYRANGYTSGTMVLANANAYYNSNQPIYTPIAGEEGYREVEDADMVFSLLENVYFLTGDNGNSYYASKPEYFQDADGNDLFTKYNKESYIKLTDEAKADLLTISANFGDTNPEAYKEWCFTYDGVSESVDWNTVGLIKTGEYEIVLVLEKPITEFYLLYNLSSNWIVYKDLYEANKKPSGSLTKTTYGTAVDNYMSYGPYKLTEYQTDKQITLEKNEAWYGYTDGKHEGQFQTSKINTQVIAAQATALQLFLQGKLDSVSLVDDDMETYRASDYVLYTPQSYTSKLTFNTSYASLKARQSEGINKTILANIDFRKALSLSIDRIEFAAQCTATHKAGYGFLNYMYVNDPDTGELYRNSEYAKKALTNFYGVSSEDEITGYDKEQAAQLFTKAYEDTLAKGDIKETDKVELEFLVYSNDDLYVKTIKFIQDAFDEASKGTPLEGRIVIKMTPDPDYYDKAKQGFFEIITSTWGGSSMDPFGITEVYADKSIYHEYGFEPEKLNVTIEINGESLTKNFYEWYEALCNTDYAVADVDTRTKILAAMEEAFLSTYVATPMYYRTTATLDSRKVINATDEFVQLVEFGGIRFLTYAYDDVAWEAYCAENNNQLSY